MLGYVEARKKIYIPSYCHVLDRHCDLLEEIDCRQKQGDVVLLDDELNGNVEDTTKPLSHARLIRLWLCGVRFGT